MGSQVTLTDAEKTRLLAEGVIGWHAKPSRVHAKQSWHDAAHRFQHFLRDWDPLTNEAHAAEVREAMRAKGWSCLQLQSADGVNMCDFFIDATTPLRANSSSETPAMAICHSALLALELAKEEEL